MHFNIIDQEPDNILEIVDSSILNSSLINAPNLLILSALVDKVLLKKNLMTFQVHQLSLISLLKKKKLSKKQFTKINITHQLNLKMLILIYYLMLESIKQLPRIFGCKSAPIPFLAQPFSKRRERTTLIIIVLSHSHKNFNKK